MFSSDNMSHGHPHRPLLLCTHGLRHCLQRQPSMGPFHRLDTHNRRLLSTLESPVPSFFRMLKLPTFFFSPSCPSYICTLWWLWLKADHIAGGPLGSILHPHCMMWWQVGVYGLPVLCTERQVCGGLVVHRSLSSVSTSPLSGGRWNSVCLWPACALGRSVGLCTCGMGGAQVDVFLLSYCTAWV